MRLMNGGIIAGPILLYFADAALNRPLLNAKIPIDSIPILYRLLYPDR